MKSPETYGRDSMAPAVRLFDATLADIKRGSFRPERFVKVLDEPVAASEHGAENETRTVTMSRAAAIQMIAMKLFLDYLQSPASCGIWSCPI